MDATEPALFDDAIALESLGEGVYRTEIPMAWTASGRASGGLVEAQLFTGAADSITGSEVQPLSFTAHLLRAAETGAAEVHVELLREGRSLVNLAARMVQNDRLIATALVSFGLERPGPDFDELPMPVVAPPLPIAERTASFRSSPTRSERASSSRTGSDLGPSRRRTARWNESGGWGSPTLARSTRPAC